MQLFISDAFAQASSAPAEPGLAANIIPLVLIFAIFYFLLIRPQHQKIKAHSALVDALKKGDDVVTSGGIIGKVVKVEEGTPILEVEISTGVVVRMNRSAITDVLGKKEKEEKISDKKTTEKKTVAKKK
jgi:preprotein translocase subunit YajC